MRLNKISTLFLGVLNTQMPRRNRPRHKRIFRMKKQISSNRRKKTEKLFTILLLMPPKKEQALLFLTKSRKQRHRMKHCRLWQEKLKLSPPAQKNNFMADYLRPRQPP